MAGRLRIFRSLTFLAMLGFWALPAFSAPLAAGDLLVVTSPNNNSSVTIPNVYHLDPTGAFQGFFFSPFSPSDIAVDHSGNVLFASPNSGTIVETNTSGAFLGFIPTPVTNINGLAVAANGDLIVNNGSTFYQLDPHGNFLSLTFSPVQVGNGNFGQSAGIGAQGDNVAVFPTAGSGGFPSNEDIAFLDLTTGALTRVHTTLGSIFSVDVSENGDIFAIGSQQFFGSPSTIFQLDSTGAVLGQIGGPQNAIGLAVANLPEPGTAVLMGLGLSMLSLRGRRDTRWARGFKGAGRPGAKFA
jgi:hypothetical protein